MSQLNYDSRIRVVVFFYFPMKQSMEKRPYPKPEMPRLVVYPEEISTRFFNKILKKPISLLIFGGAECGLL